jgi:hypothetical protein
MALLLRARTAEKLSKGGREEIVRYPDVLRKGRLQRLYCSAAGNGRSSHQACWVSNRSHGVKHVEAAPTGTAWHALLTKEGHPRTRKSRALP